jgi:hypothetical protein
MGILYKGEFMNRETMSLARALVQLKLLDKRINKLARSGCFITYKVGSDIQNQDCRAQENLESFQDLMKRRRAIKAGLIKANAETEVEVNGEKMTIAEAIELKSSIKFSQTLREVLKEQLDRMAYNVESVNDRAQDRLDEQLKAIYGKSGKVREEDTKAVEDAFWAANKAELVDEIDIRKRIEDLDEYNDSFLAEVDLVLSEANGRVEMTIEY